jgi:tetratricopeptide (TPR) repeat protein
LGSGVARRSRARVVAFALCAAFALLVGSTSSVTAAEPTVEELTAQAEGPRDTPEQRDVVARAQFHLGEIDERARRYADALAHYRAVLAIDPGNWFAGTARARIEALQRYDVDFSSLAKLDAVRKDPARSNDPAAIEALERDIVEFPAGRARTEALLFVAEAWAGRLARPERAIEPALQVARDPGADPTARATAFELAYSALHALGDLDRAARDVADDPAAPAPIVRRIHRELRRRTLHRVSAASLAFSGVLLAASLLEATRRRRLAITIATARNRWALAFLATAGLGAYVIAELWERGAGGPFLALVGVLAGVHVLVAALRGGFGDRGPVLRVVFALGAASCMLAAAYLVLERGEAMGRPMLEGFGL